MTLQKLYADIGEDYAQALRVLRMENWWTSTSAGCPETG